ncbi:hypothetical protein DC522_22700 [Microvirga sp. KLBC 81]|uniref:hypothetical protein n=1 Tax=Microvirga sp. KLBC 81 TaxID=1862707 RepID=UPI000D515E50|nr:hypothetical protein [Microvirga sp. KLBC 81]PVE22124.1 hypothetical protein DC522_22700 [Microvirga sp. KLBC 81]
MRRPSDADRASGLGQGPRQSSQLETVASTGVPVRLVRQDPERVRRLQDLIVACESLRVEWEHVFERLMATLEDEIRGAPSPEDPRPDEPRA